MTYENGNDLVIMQVTRKQAQAICELLRTAVVFDPRKQSASAIVILPDNETYAGAQGVQLAYLHDRHKPKSLAKSFDLQQKITL